jgi:hypothetical protein
MNFQCQNQKAPTTWLAQVINKAPAYVVSYCRGCVRGHRGWHHLDCLVSAWVRHPHPFHRANVRTNGDLPWFRLREGISHKTLRPACLSSLRKIVGTPAYLPVFPLCIQFTIPGRSSWIHITELALQKYIIHYIMSSNSLTWPLGWIQMPRRASSLTAAADTRIASVARSMPTLQATDQEMGPSLHRHHQTPHLRHHSLPHNLTK